jgi:hypothetical protein
VLDKAVLQSFNFPFQKSFSNGGATIIVNNNPSLTIKINSGPKSK